MVSPSRTTRRMKWEHGEAYPIGTETVAAPATVSGERHPASHWPDSGPGRRSGAETREPGDLPSGFLLTPGGVARKGRMAWWLFRAVRLSFRRSEARRGGQECVR